LPVTLLSLDTWTTAYCRHSVSLDAFDGDTIRVAFRHRASGSGNDVYLDDVWFSRTSSPDTGDTSHVHIPPRGSVQRSNVQLPRLAFAPNPAEDRFVAVQCSLAVGRRRRMTLSNVAGRVVRMFALDPSGITRLDLRGLPPGVYVATLEGTVPRTSRKLVLAAP
ncbi:MAG TPA: hypothetical protein VMH22_14400, partial [bacterium]|nr:hypothetical protein [bacterium]